MTFAIILLSTKSDSLEVSHLLRSNWPLCVISLERGTYNSLGEQMELTYAAPPRWSGPPPCLFTTSATTRILSPRNSLQSYEENRSKDV